ncbi:MAG: hypothetical protein NZ740_05565, partial [Kiritimatiellae bacterium]|nr:hypothetical protein [Kiritimatiellia bacterium]MDW8458561.1 hypothetical protein [Verrucomicrobiota bacterium]
WRARFHAGLYGTGWNLSLQLRTPWKAALQWSGWNLHLKMRMTCERYSTVGMESARPEKEDWSRGLTDESRGVDRLRCVA